MKKPTKYPGIPAELRRCATEYAKLRKAGKPIPDTIRRGYNEYRRWVTNGGVEPPAKSARIIYADIPEKLRESDREYVGLRKAGKPIPDTIRRDHNKYRRLLRKKTAKPATKSRVIHDFIPEHLRRAHNAYQKMKRRGEPVPPDIFEARQEYHRWLKHGSEPPPKKEEPRREYYDEYLQYNRDRREGMSPGLMPRRIIEGRARYMGVRPHRYTKCSPSDHQGERGCTKQHGNGPKRLPYGDGVAMCTVCNAAYTGVPKEVTACGCCGKPLRKSPRS